jgi:hypothetical protein
MILGSYGKAVIVPQTRRFQLPDMWQKLTAIGDVAKLTRIRKDNPLRVSFHQREQADRLFQGGEQPVFCTRDDKGISPVHHHVILKIAVRVRVIRVRVGVVRVLVPQTIT